MSNEKIQFGSKEIQFQLEYHQRKTLGITVNPDRQVVVKAPLDAPIDKVKEKITKRAPWILKQQSFFLSFEPRTPPRKYIGGESHLYLGRQYRLKIIPARKEVVKLMRGYIEVHTLDKKRVKPLLLEWYRARAIVKFHQYAAPYIEAFQKYSVLPTEIVIQWMDKRWGSCTPKGKILLNTELIKTPRRCIEYVIVHELCHLVHYNHSKAFFELQEREMRDWAYWKEQLESLA